MRVHADNMDVPHLGSNPLSTSTSKYMNRCSTPLLQKASCLPWDISEQGGAVIVLFCLWVGVSFSRTLVDTVYR